MKLTFDEIISISDGYTRTEISEKGLSFFRFSQTSEEGYQESLPYFANEAFFDGYFNRNCRTTSGVVLDFLTDSSSLSITLGDYELPNGASGGRFGLYIDGKYSACRQATNSLSFRLPAGREKRVTVYFPLYTFPVIASVELDDGAHFDKVPTKGVMVCYGDSITHGGGANNPGQTWPAILTRKLGYSLLNQGNSGYVYDAKVILRPEDARVQPSFIVAAYGTNDRSRKMPEPLKQDADEFWARMKRLYPKTPCALILPTWTTYDEMDEWKERFAACRESLLSIAEKYQISVYDGLRYIPHKPNYFADKAVHPNNTGHRLYGTRLYREMAEREPALK